MQYFRLSQNYISNQLIPVGNYFKHITDFDQSWYCSVFKYNEDHFAEWEKTRSLAGADSVVGDQLYWDFDSYENLELARQNTIELRDRLLKLGITRTQIQIFFSGKKGFSVTVLMGGDFTPIQIKAFCISLASGLQTLDDRIYDNQRILRIPCTKHQDTGLYKIMLSDEQLNETVDSIKRLAEVKPDHQEYVAFLMQNEVRFAMSEAEMKKYTVTKKRKKSLQIQADTDPENPFPTIDWSKRLKFLTPEKYVLHCGYFPVGQRHHALMILGSTYKFLGYTAGDTYRLLKSAIEKQAELHNVEPFSHDELWTNVICTIYSDTWNGGVYGNDHPILADIHSKLPAHLKKKSDEFSIVGNAFIHSKLTQFMGDLKTSKFETGFATLDESLILLSGTAVGLLGVPGCHAKGTQVVMFDGSLKNVEDVKVGEFLMGPDSQPREVLKLAQGRDTMVRITPFRSESFIVNMDHIMHLVPSKLKEKDRFGGHTNISLKNYIKGCENLSQSIKGYVMKRQGVEFNEKDLTIDPYILGTWLADGTSTKPEFTSMDHEVVQAWLDYAIVENGELSKVADAGKAVTYRYKVHQNGTHLNTFTSRLKEYDILGDKRIPEIYLTSSRSQRLNLLAGIIDGDGCVEANGCGWNIAVTKNDLAQDVLRLCRSLGFHASLTPTKTSWNHNGEKKEGMTNDIYISGLSDILEVPVKIDRRKIRRVMTSKNPTHYNFSYEILGEGDYYGFTLDKDHLYLTSDFMIHHNSSKTSILMNIMRNYSKRNSSKSVGLFYSLDMPPALIGIKQIQFLTGLKIPQILELMEKDPVRFEQLQVAASQDFANVSYSFRYGISPANIREDVIQYEAETGKKVNFIVVDYLEQVHSGYEDPNIGAGYAAQQIANIAGELDLIAFILLQTQKTVRPGEPIQDMRSVKGGSMIEQCLSVLLGIHREGQPVKYQSHDQSVTVSVLKNRFGSLKTMVLGWDGATGRVSDLTKDQKLIYDDLIRIKAEEAEAERTKYTGW